MSAAAHETSTSAPRHRVLPAPGFNADAFVGECCVCGEHTKKKGSARKAETAIRDHVLAKHP